MGISELFPKGSCGVEELVLLKPTFSSLLLEGEKPGWGTTSLSSEGLLADATAWSSDKGVG